MLDIRRIRENLEDIKKAIERRGEKEFNLDIVVELDDQRRELLKEVEVMKNEMNVESKKIPQLIKEGKDVTADKARLKEAHKAASEVIKELLLNGENVAFLTLGDPTVYSTYCYVHNLVLEGGMQAEIVPGVPSFCAVAARLNEGLTEASEALHIIPASYDGLEDALELDGTKVLMKSGTKIGAVKEKILEKCENETVRMVEKCGMEGEKIYDSLDEIDEDASYFSVLVVKKR